MDEQGRAEVNRSKASSDDCTLVRGTVKARGDEEIREVTQNLKLEVLELMQCRRSEHGEQAHRERPHVCGYKQPLQAWKTHQHGKIKNFIDVEERAITKNSAAVLSTLMARNIAKKISLEGAFPRDAAESEETRQDVEGAVNEGMKTQVSVDDMPLCVCEVIDKNFEEEYMEEINECAEKCHEPENHDDFAWDGVNELQGGASTSPTDTKGRGGVLLPTESCVQERTSAEVQECVRGDADQGLVDRHQQPRRSKL